MKTRNHRQTLAAHGEAKAADFLESRGYRVIDRNVRTPSGEIDLIALREAGHSAGDNSIENIIPLTLFVEVKTRRSTSFGYPEQAITARKRLHMLAAAEEFIQMHPEYAGEWRIDVIAIQYQAGSAEAEIYHFENAVVKDV